MIFTLKQYHISKKKSSRKRVKSRNLASFSCFAFALVRSTRRIHNISERVFSAKDYTCQGHVVQASWINERFNAYKKVPVKKRLVLVAGDIREHLRCLMGMWEEAPKANVILKSLNKMLIIKDTFALYKDFYQYLDKKDIRWTE